MEISLEVALNQKCANSLSGTYSKNSVAIFDDFLVEADVVEYKYKDVDDGYKAPFFAVLIAFLIINALLLVCLVVSCCKCKSESKKVFAAKQEAKKAEAQLKDAKDKNN